MKFNFNVQLDTLELNKLKINLYQLHNMHIKHGWFDKYKNGRNISIPYATIALMQEFGEASKNIPARPYFQQAILLSVPLSKPFIKQLFKTALQNRIFLPQLHALGLAQKAAYNSSIALQNMKELSDITVAKKGHETQMIESHEMVDNYDYQVGIGNWLVAGAIT